MALIKQVEDSKGNTFEYWSIIKYERHVFGTTWQVQVVPHKNKAAKTSGKKHSDEFLKCFLYSTIEMDLVAEPDPEKSIRRGLYLKLKQEPDFSGSQDD